MNRDERLLRGSGMSQQAEIPQKPYRWNGTPGWDPASLGPIPSAEQEKQERAAEFGRLRELGLSVRDAAAAVGVADDTGRWYERQRKRRAGAQ